MGFPILVRWHLYIESGPSISDKVNMLAAEELPNPSAMVQYKDVI